MLQKYNTISVIGQIFQKILFLPFPIHAHGFPSPSLQEFLFPARSFQSHIRFQPLFSFNKSRISVSNWISAGGAGGAGFWDPERLEQYLADPVKIVDAGDVDIHPMDFQETFDNITECVRKIISKGAIPVMMGGDHAVTYPTARALDMYDDLCVVQFDAHLDFGLRRYTNGSPMRLISEMPHFTKMCQIGMRGLGSNTREDFLAAYDYGSVVIPARKALDLGSAEVIKMIPQAKNYFVTIDIDNYDMNTAPGVGSPSPGGLNYPFVTDVLEGIAKKGNVVAFDLVEVAPQYDPTGITARLGAMTMLAFMGYIMKEREKKGLLKAQQG